MSSEICYDYITFLLKNQDKNMNQKELNYYDLILVNFTEPHIHKYELEFYGSKIKLSNSLNKFVIEKNYLIESNNKKNPYLLVKLSNEKFGYIHTSNFNPIEFEIACVNITQAILIPLNLIIKKLLHLFSFQMPNNICLIIYIFLIIL